LGKNLLLLLLYCRFGRFLSPFLFSIIVSGAKRKKAKKDDTSFPDMITAAAA
jgi:hypothetical protein